MPLSHVSGDEWGLEATASSLPAKQTKSGHQTSILSTDYRSDLTVVSDAMFARWSQEDFLKYMRQHYNIDRLIDYSIEEIPETTVVVIPQYRSLDTDVR